MRHLISLHGPAGIISLLPDSDVSVCLAALCVGCMNLVNKNIILRVKTVGRVISFYREEMPKNYLGSLFSNAYCT